MSVEDWMFQLPTGEIGILDIMFGIPNMWTDGMYINMLVAGFFGVFFISSMYMQDRPDLQNASIYSSVGTFIITLGLVILSTYTDSQIAGENQLIPVAVVMIASILWAYISKGETI